DGGYQLCNPCYKRYKIKTVFISSGNKVIDDFIRCTLTESNKMAEKLEFVPYDRFTNVEFIAEGGFSKIYRATWIDGPISEWSDEKLVFNRSGKMIVALKELGNSKNINSKE